MRRVLRDADAHRHPPAAELFHRNPGADPLGHERRRADRGLDQHHHELLPAVAGHAVHGARRPAEDFRDLHQRRVAGGVAVCVVVLFEVIEVS